MFVAEIYCTEPDGYRWCVKQSHMIEKKEHADVVCTRLLKEAVEMWKHPDVSGFTPSVRGFVKEIN